MLATKSNAGMGSGSYYMKHNKQPMLLSEHTFKGQEQELSTFAHRVATRHSLAAAGFTAVLSPPHAAHPGGPGETARNRASDTGDGGSAYGELAANAVQERNAHTAATKQRYQKKQ